MKKKAALVMAVLLLTLQLSVSFAGDFDYPVPRYVKSVQIVSLK